MEHKKLDEFTRRLKDASPQNLKSVILYGSAATEDFHSKHSDLNVVCILGIAGAAELAALHAPVQWWIRQGQRPPLIFTLEELRRSADVFTIELLDMKSHHRILFGENVLADLSVPLHYHPLQVERELRTNWLHLRQAMLTTPSKSKSHLELMAASFSSFTALFRHALLALGKPTGESRRDVIDRIGQFADADPIGFYTLLDYREGKCKEREIDVPKTLDRYLFFVEAVTDKFDRELDLPQ
jgi:hypothetical protein